MIMPQGFYTLDELKEIGLASYGENVFISRRCSIYGANRIKIGSNVRIDDFCVLSAGEGGIEIESHVHIAVYTSLIGKGKISIDDFTNISSKVAIYSSNDDYSGAFMTNPMVPEQYTNVTHGDVVLGKHVIVGSGAIVLPNVVLADGVCIGALSLVASNCEEFGVYVGVPAKKVKQRKTNLLELEAQMMGKHNVS